MSDMGHNLVAGDELNLLFERIERLEEEKKGIADDIKDVFAEGKSRGYDVKIMRHAAVGCFGISWKQPSRPLFWRTAPRIGNSLPVVGNSRGAVHQN
jgi:hypothetical protein